MTQSPAPSLRTPGELASQLDAPDLRVIDASWYLPDAGRDARAEYVERHIPGAIYLDLSTDLADLGAPVRNTIPDPERLAVAFAGAGIGTEHRVVVYDRTGGLSAGRIWWALTYAGHSRVSLLDGGLAAWRAAGLALSSEIPRPGRARFDARPRPESLASKADVLRVLERGDAVIVDARSPARFRGQGAEHTRYKGRIPGSINVPASENLTGDPPRIRDLESLRSLYRTRGVDFARPVIVSCGSGVTASLDAFVLTLLGHREVSVYDGSWAEWGNADDTPIERG